MRAATAHSEPPSRVAVRVFGSCLSAAPAPVAPQSLLGAVAVWPRSAQSSSPAGRATKREGGRGRRGVVLMLQKKRGGQRGRGRCGGDGESVRRRKLALHLYLLLPPPCPPSLSLLTLCDSLSTSLSPQQHGGVFAFR